MGKLLHVEITCCRECPMCYGEDIPRCIKSQMCIYNKDILQTWCPLPDLPEEVTIVRSVIEYLNQKLKLDTSHHGFYKTTREKTKKYILARAKEGYTLDDFIKVIDVKAEDWLNTDMAKFMRPDTLFSPTHFEEYRVQWDIVQKEKKQKPTEDRRTRYD